MQFDRLVCNDHPARSALTLALDLGLLAFAVFIIDWPLLVSHSLWPEDALAWHSRALTAGDVLQSYVAIDTPSWYRPTTMHTIPWLTSHFIGWHQIVRLRAVGCLILVAACWAIYAFALMLFPGRRAAGLVAALYFASHPALHLTVFHFIFLDNTHILFVIATAAFYLMSLGAARDRGRLFVGLSLACYLIALTSKEASVLAPLYLAAISGLAVAVKVGPPTAGLKRWFLDAKPIIVREFLRLLPFLVLMVAFYVARLSYGQKPAPTGGYRTWFNGDAIFGNLCNFSLWIARVFSWTGGMWFDAYKKPLYTGVGIAIFAVLIVGGAALWRQGWAYRRSVLLCLAWIAVFLLVPAYCGGYGHHINLALVGYAVLLGAAVTEAASLMHRPTLGRLLPVLLLVGLVVLGRANTGTYLSKGMHASICAMNGSALFTPPVPASELGTAPLIYVEDQRHLQTWSYGVGRLFRYVYDNKQIQERVVPPMEEVPPDLAAAWLNHPRAFFFSYGDDGRWSDNSKAFGVFARAAAGQPQGWISQRGTESVSKE